MSTLVGMQLSGRYRLDAQIGAGGMSTVYRAFDANLERRVAIKLLHREIAADSDQLERFRREVSATLAAVLDRMTEKSLEHRYADIPALIADLEEALAIEAARLGTSTGEATAVIRTLPAHAKRRLPFRMRHPVSLLAVSALVAVGALIAALA